MKLGFIQQVDVPQAMYDNPANMYVAGFIGTPQMNFIDATIQENGKDAYLQIGNSRVKMPEKRSAKIVGQGYDGKEVVIGLRPEHLFDEQMYIDQMPEAIVDSKVEVVELLGPEALVYCIIEDTNMIARVNPRTKSRPGDNVKIALDTNRLHIFDKETENVLFED
jgi:multiple sugar transport system ATP-binding protein